MPTVDKIFYVFVFNLCAIILLLVLYVTFQNDIISSVRAVGIQCNADYTIDIPDPSIENLKK